jgi:hypothetical protein
MHHEFEFCWYVYYYISIVIYNETSIDKSPTKYVSMFHILRSCMTSNRKLRRQKNTIIHQNSKPNLYMYARLNGYKLQTH